ncbi:MAG: hypothetical protein IH600_14965 [Bacteroidetes bacterium]|nr:hypothetical protein [Bacteroidota bacterium]
MAQSIPLLWYRWNHQGCTTRGAKSDKARCTCARDYYCDNTNATGQCNALDYQDARQAFEHDAVDDSSPMVERWFRDLTAKQIRRGVFHSVDELIKKIMAYIGEHWVTLDGQTDSDLRECPEFCVNGKFPTME